MRGWASGCLLVFSACQTVPRNSPELLAQLSATPRGYVRGAPVALGTKRVLNREDFVYDAKFSPGGQKVALSRLGLKAFQLTVHSLEPEAAPLVDVPVNGIEFDVEAVEFSPDGLHLAAVSRDGVLRLFSAASGALEKAWLADEPLVSVAWHPSGASLAFGSAKGLITVISVPQGQHVAELRAHGDEVRGLAFTPQGDLVSGGWDQSLQVLRLETAPTAEMKVRTQATQKNGLTHFRLVLNDSVSTSAVLDARLPLVVMTKAVAEAAGIDLRQLTAKATLVTALGKQLAPVAARQHLAIKNLNLNEVEVAVCDACVPPGAQMVLGGPVLESIDPSFDTITGELVFSAPPGHSSVAQTLKVVRRFKMPGAINDLSLDAQGRMVGLALSETKAERTKAVYDLEKKNEPFPVRPGDCGVRVDVESGQILDVRRGHLGPVVTVGVSPDGTTLATGGWDKKVLLHGTPVAVDEDYGWAIRRVRFSRDGRQLVVAAWTPQNPLGNHHSKPAAVTYELIFGAGTSVGRVEP